MGLNRKLAAALVAVAGSGSLIAGVWMVYMPAALIVAGLLLLAFGLAANVDEDEVSE